MINLKESELIHLESQHYTNGTISFKKYMVILDYLKSKKSYKEYFLSKNLKQIKINKLEIDRLLNAVLGIDIRYTKKEINNCLNFNKMSKQSSEICKESEKLIKSGVTTSLDKDFQNKIIFKTLCDALNKFPDNYKFTTEELFVIKSYIKLPFVHEYEIKLFTFNLNLRIEIVINFICALLNNKEAFIQKDLFSRFMEIFCCHFPYKKDKKDEKQSKSIDYALKRLYKKFGDNYLIKTINFLAFLEYIEKTYVWNEKNINKKNYYKNYCK